MGKRKYTKRSPYWDKFKEKSPEKLTATFEQEDTTEPALLGEPFFHYDEKGERAIAYSRTPSSSTRPGRRNAATKKKPSDKFRFIENGMLPYEEDAEGIGVKEAIVLCQKAYSNIAVFRNAVDMMQEFTNSDIYLDGGTAKSRRFFETWMRVIRINKLKRQYFLERFRSGNIFLFKGYGRLTDSARIKIAELFGKAVKPMAAKIPLSYTLLNPAHISVQNSSSFASPKYLKKLTTYEKTQLSKRETGIDKLIYESLDTKSKKALSLNLNSDIYIDLATDLLRTSFFKKQDYEPLAIPVGYPVLEDINAKIEMKKLDQALMRTIENVILLITMGTEPEKGGINKKNMSAMQKLFENESVGRVLIADYTTEADFIIPDLKKVLDPKRYETLNEDIREGLQNIMVGQDKYSGAEMKAQIFMDKLKESRDAFLEDFLIPEMEETAMTLGLKNIPTPKFKKLHLEDNVELMNTVLRMIENGVLHPKQGVRILRTGEIPDEEELSQWQETLVEDRKKGFYNPIIGGQPVMTDEEEDLKMKKEKLSFEQQKEALKQQKEQPKEPMAGKPPVKKSDRSGGRPSGTKKVSAPAKKALAKYSYEKLKKAAIIATEIEASIKAQLQKTTSSKTTAKKAAKALSERIISKFDMSEWKRMAVEAPLKIEEYLAIQPSREVDQIASEFDLGIREASLLRASEN
jgi:hypothetical protein